LNYIRSGGNALSLLKARFAWASFNFKDSNPLFRGRKITSSPPQKIYGTFSHKDWSCLQRTDFTAPEHFEQVFDRKDLFLPARKYPVAKVSAPGVS
jgi:hypothetical protein